LTSQYSAEQSTNWHEVWPEHSTVHVLPPHVTPPPHAFWFVQLIVHSDARLQSTSPTQLVCPPQST
jgi:hypothetical protein